MVHAPLWFVYTGYGCYFIAFFLRWLYRREKIQEKRAEQILGAPGNATIEVRVYGKVIIKTDAYYFVARTLMVADYIKYELRSSQPEIYVYGKKQERPQWYKD